MKHHSSEVYRSGQNAFMANKEQVFETMWHDRKLSIKTGLLARQATAAVTVQYGETVVLATVVESETEREGIDFFPLMVDFEERLYAAGIIKGSRWVKRDGRPTDEGILTGRMIDRSIRPLFDQKSRREVQVMLTTLSVDQENDYDIVALVAASAVLSISGIEWAGPLGGIRIGKIDGKLVFNPNYKEQALSTLDLIVSATEKKVIMIEAGANETPEKEIIEAILAGQRELQPAVALIKKLQASVPPKERHEHKHLVSQDEIEAEVEKKKLFAIAEAWLAKNIKPILFNQVYYTKGERKLAIKAIKEQLDQYLFDQNIGKDRRAQIISHLVETAVDAEVTRAILEDGKRVDGRKFNEIRPLSANVGVLPRNHGAGLFSRGETQVMSIVTLGAPGMEQTLENMEGTSYKRYMHHYNFPPYCVGEAKPNRGLGRRDIGHGALAEKALFPMIPSKEDFPYTVRVVSETMGSNGSSSMGSTCGSTLALMDAGVPIRKPVAGIAIGLASNADMSKWVVLTDIQDLEDGEGGMDFKITGTDTGITAIQLDTKTYGLNEEIIRQTFKQGREALNEILKVMTAEIKEPRKELSKYAPRIISFMIDPEKIGTVIGPGGKMIKEITHGSKDMSIDIDDSGLVMICGTNAEECQEAERKVKDIVHEFSVGEIIKGKVVRMLDFGAFIQLNAGHDGMAHVSELAPYRIEKPFDFLEIGQEVTVKIIEVDDQKRINLTLKGLAENQDLWKNEKGKSTGAPSFGGGSRFGGGGRSSGRSGGGSRFGGSGRR